MNDPSYDLRLEQILREAREAGCLAALQELLERWAQAAAAAERDARPPTDVPMRFGMVGDSPEMRKVFELIEKVAPSEVPVLVLGETGTGKELAARALHDHSRRKKKPFLAENCAAVSPHLLESELFGHKKGSFTGAVRDRDGHFMTADGGTLFLDEIGDMPLDMQSKLLRVLQDGEIRAVGSSKTRKVNVRVVAATNKDLAAMCKQGTFREDLYYRLNVISIELPPLREREGDVEHLVDFFCGQLSQELGISVRVAPDALEALVAAPWPGNVRELENELRRAAALSGGAIGAGDLSARLT